MAILSFSIINFKPCIPKKYIPGHCNETRERNWINGALFMCDDGDFCSPITLLEPLYFTSTPTTMSNAFWSLQGRTFSESSLLFFFFYFESEVDSSWGRELQLFSISACLRMGPVLATNSPNLWWGFPSKKKGFTKSFSCSGVDQKIKHPWKHHWVLWTRRGSGPPQQNVATVWGKSLPTIP